MSFVPTLIDQALESYLVTTLGVPVWANHIPQFEYNYPQLVYQCVETTPKYTLNNAAGLVQVLYQIDVYGTDAASVDTTTESLRVALESYRGMMATVLVTGCRSEDMIQTYEANPAGADLGWYRIMSDWTLFYQETLPIY
jgi:hypothetical protein